MKVVVLPADDAGCGKLRLSYPAQYLREQGHDITVIEPDQRQLDMRMRGEEVIDVPAMRGVDVVVFQRLTHAYTAQAVSVLRRQGTAVVIDVDDDLASIHPSNPAWAALHPRTFRKRGPDGKINMHSWRYLTQACRDATLVTVSAPALLTRYASHGRGHVIYNHLPEYYFGVPHEDTGVLGWPASLASHPDDPSVVGGAVARLTAAGADFRVVGNPAGAGAAFGLRSDPQGLHADTTPEEWPAAVSRLGVGLAPLSDTRFNSSKSFLKPLEMSALGIPWVASPRAEYARFHRTTGAGVLAERPKEWYRLLRRLMDDPQLRKEKAEEGIRAAEAYRMKPNAELWLEAWSRARELQTAGS